jgi:hypothetical protein
VMSWRFTQGRAAAVAVRATRSGRDQAADTMMPALYPAAVPAACRQASGPCPFPAARSPAPGIRLAWWPAKR